MSKAAFRVTLDAPLIASSDVATAAAPSTLPYLPGAMLWGVLASAAYRAGAASEAILDRLHGGGLIVGDAWAEGARGVALPAPKSLHQSKDGGNWEDWTREAHKAGWRQAKGQQVEPWDPHDLTTLPEVKVRTITSNRTAIDPTELRAADGQFYGLQALAVGQSFVAVIEGGDQTQVDAAVTTLTGARFLGRSRNAEFGAVTIAAVPVPALPVPAPGPNATILWCLSDLAALDAHHQPTERPDRLLGAQIDWSRSFVRHRTYSPFNAKWATRQSERLVIARGSVLTLKSPVDAGYHRTGLWTEQGLGLVLASALPPRDVLTAWEAATGVVRGQTPPATMTPLSNMLDARAHRLKTIKDQNAEALGVWAAIWKVRYEAAERLQGERCGPRPSQWSQVANKTTVVELRQFLTGAQTSGGARETLSWQARFAEGSENTFAAAALALLTDDGAKLRRTATALRDALKRERWFDAG